MMMLNNKKQPQRSSTLEIILAVVAIASILVLSGLVLIIAIQEANAALTASTTFSLDQTQTNKCTGFTSCSNTGTITFGSGEGHTRL